MTRPRRLLTIGHSYCVRRNRELAEALATAETGGWDVTVVAPTRFPGDFGPIATAREPDERIDLRPVPVHGARRIHFMRYGRGLRRLLAEPWDVVHCWEEPYVMAAAQVARAVHPRSSLVFASFQNIAKRYPPPFGALERYSMRRAAGWIAFGMTIAATLEQRPAYAERPHAVIPFGVDLTRFSPEIGSRSEALERIGWTADGPPVVGYLGRFVEGKGLPLLLDTLIELERRGVAWRALLVGGGPLEPRLREFATARNDRVRVVTGVAHGDVPRHLRCMDVLCAPSRTTAKWREQFGRVIVEAFACEVAVVGSDSGEIPFVIGDAGVVIGEDNRAGWVDALARLLSDGGARRELALRGRARAKVEFAWPVIAKRHLDFFEQLTAT